VAWVLTTLAHSGLESRLMDIRDPMMERDAKEVCDLFQQWLGWQVLGNVNIFEGEEPVLSDWHLKSSFQGIGRAVLFFSIPGPILRGLVDVVKLGSRRNARRVFFNTRCAFLHCIVAFMGDGMTIRRAIIVSIPRSDISRVVQEYPLQKGCPV
jgi:hypothetical protein